ncbi:prefoldin subunit alpha [Candidatus Pyrohabitans sp.]
MTEEKGIPVEKVLADYEMMRSQAEALQQNLDLINQHIAEFRLTLSTLEEIEKLEDGNEILVPMGSGSFTKAEIKDTGSVILSLGAEVAARKSIDEAKLDLQARVEELEKVREEHNSRLGEIMKNLEAIAPVVEQILAAMQQSQLQRGEDVRAPKG